MKTSPEMENYFGLIEKNLLNAYDLATRARKKGLDPEETVNIPLAKDMAERVTGLISSVAPQILESNINERNKELEKGGGSDSYLIREGKLLLERRLG